LVTPYQSWLSGNPFSNVENVLSPISHKECSTLP
jgi:hypothetical protein